jgi:type II secretory pathway component PulK
VLVVIVLTISSVYAFARTTVLDVASQRHRVERARARLLASSGFAIAQRAVLDDASPSAENPLGDAETRRDPWYLLGRAPIELPQEGANTVPVIDVRVRDSGSRLNLNGLLEPGGKAHAESLAFLEAVLEKIVADMPGRAEDKHYDPVQLAETLLDWIDLDAASRLGEDEQAHYARLGSSGPPLDRPLLSLGELAGAPGLDPPLLEALAQYFTTQPLYVAPEHVGINPNTAPPHLLAAIYVGAAAEEKRLLDEDDVFRILRLRDEGRVFCPEAGADECVTFAPEIIRLGETVFPPLQFQSDVFEIESVGKYGESRARLSAVLDRSKPAEPKILYYRMD